MNKRQACRDLILEHKAEILCLKSVNMAMLKLSWPMVLATALGKVHRSHIKRKY
jgi:hypothetical protein